jgi:hypothetical protein
MLLDVLLTPLWTSACPCLVGLAVCECTTYWVLFYLIFSKSKAILSSHGEGRDGV